MQSNSEKGFILRIIESSLALWIRTRCRSINNITVKINPSNTSITKGYISEVFITGKEINFQNIPIDYLQLSGKEIQIKANMLGKKIYFNKNFIVKWEMNISSRSLEELLLSDQWNWLGNLICQKLLGMNHFDKVKIKNDYLEITCSNTITSNTKIDDFNLNCTNGKLILTNKNSSGSFQIPMDESISIKNAYLKNCILSVFGKAKIYQ